MADKIESRPAASNVDDQARQQTGGQQVRLHIDDREMSTIYANAFRTSTTAEEIILDFGMNLVVPSQAQQGGAAGGASGGGGGSGGEPAGDILFKLNNRVVMNYYTAKRLALLLGQVVTRHEERFGELKLNAAERVVRKG